MKWPNQWILATKKKCIISDPILSKKKIAKHVLLIKAVMIGEKKYIICTYHVFFLKRCESICFDIITSALFINFNPITIWVLSHFHYIIWSQIRTHGQRWFPDGKKFIKLKKYIPMNLLLFFLTREINTHTRSK